MFKNCMRIAFRNLNRNKGFSAINILGLAIGMASAMIILLWIQSEVSYDTFHEKKDRIYEAWNRASFSGAVQSWNTTPKVLARTMEKDLPEVEQAARVNFANNSLLTAGEKKLTVSGYIVDSNFLQIFTFPLLQGNISTALPDMHSIVITETLSKKLFGDEDAMGKAIVLDNKDNLVVTGIVKDLPDNTRFKFEYLLSYSYYRSKGYEDLYWGNNSTTTYVLLKPNASAFSLNEKLKTFRPKYDPSEPKWEMFVYPISRWRLYSSFTAGIEDGGLIDAIHLFGIIAAFILLIACINFMNLSTARSEKRAKEVGIRKVVGAQKISLIAQFIGESILLASLAGVIAVAIVYFSLPAFSRVIGEKVAVDLSNGYAFFTVLGFILFTGLLAGSYPAFFLSSFQPVKVLKGTFKKSHALVSPRKVLVVLQFTFAIILIICTIIVKQQIDFARNRHAGYDKNNLVYHYFTGDIEKNYELIKSELLSSGVAASITKTSSSLTENWSDGWWHEWEGKDPNDKTDFDRYVQDGGLGATAGLTFLMGRDVDISRFATDSTAMIINESAWKVMKFKNPIGKIVKDRDIEWHIVGVIKDFILGSPFQATKPMLIYGPKYLSFNTILMKFNKASSMADNLRRTEKIFRKYNPHYPFSYSFIDEEYARKFEAGKRISTLASSFSALTIFISCLGLFGLAAFMAESRIKEIGVRKVLGATVTGITALLSKDFLKLVLLSFLLAVPIARWMMSKWLQDFNYRVTIQWWVFGLAGLLSVVIALLTVSSQAIKAAISNPIKNLRTE